MRLKAALTLSRVVCICLTTSRRLARPPLSKPQIQLIFQNLCPDPHALQTQPSWFPLWRWLSALDREWLCPCSPTEVRPPWLSTDQTEFPDYARRGPRPQTVPGF